MGAASSLQEGYSSTVWVLYRVSSIKPKVILHDFLNWPPTPKFHNSIVPMGTCKRTIHSKTLNRASFEVKLSPLETYPKVLSLWSEHLRS